MTGELNEISYIHITSYRRGENLLVREVDLFICDVSPYSKRSVFSLTLMSWEEAYVEIANIIIDSRMLLVLRFTYYEISSQFTCSASIVELLLTSYPSIFNFQFDSRFTIQSFPENLHLAVFFSIKYPRSTSAALCTCYSSRMPQTEKTFW